MKDGFLSTIENQIQTKIFTDEDLKLILPETTEEKIHNSLSYHFKQGHLKKYKRGVYSLVEPRNKNSISKFYLANFLYNPSYVSFESALSHYGLIPEAVYETTSACFQEKKKMFKTTEGIFSFSHSPVTPFFLDVVKDEQQSFLVANPLRALFDTIYSNRKDYKMISDLEDDLRIDLDELKQYLTSYEASEILSLGDLYKKKNTRKLAEILVKGFK
ncbi:MAG: hypothetical protein PHY93_07085 [Bacteriovorax sp.]|nr:hypothetical protein [Bacteriovorax sp.]